jgi:hypothetical protein
VQNTVAEFLGECVVVGTLASETPLEDCARIANSLYLTEIRHFLNERSPDETKGVGLLERLFSVALMGFSLECQSSSGYRFYSPKDASKSLSSSSAVDHRR